MEKKYIYAAGIEDENGDFGMMAGPSLSIEDVIAQCQHVPRRGDEVITMFRAEVGEWKAYRVKAASGWEWKKAKPRERNRLL